MGEARCDRCGGPASTVVIELPVLMAYLDLCQVHLGDLLRNARPIERRLLTTARDDA
jgi:hypothetical protein